MGSGSFAPAALFVGTINAALFGGSITAALGCSDCNSTRSLPLAVLILLGDQADYREVPGDDADATGDASTADGRSVPRAIASGSHSRPTQLEMHRRQTLEQYREG